MTAHYRPEEKNINYNKIHSSQCCRSGSGSFVRLEGLDPINLPGLRRLDPDHSFGYRRLDPDPDPLYGWRREDMDLDHLSWKG